MTCTLLGDASMPACVAEPDIFISWLLGSGAYEQRVQVKWQWVITVYIRIYK